jgi:hypothetical protein
MSNDARISTALPGHPKTKKLMKRLGPSGPLGCVYLFIWAAANRSDGDLTGMTNEDIELAVDWTGEDGVFVQAMRDVGFLDGEAGELVIHDWSQHNPWAAGSGMRAAKARWNAIKRHHGQAEADKQVPEYAAVNAQSNAPSNATSMLVASTQHADSMHAASAQHASSNAPSPSPSPSPSPLPKTVANATDGKPSAMTPDEIIFGYGVPLLTQAGSTDKAARSFLGGIRKNHGDEALIDALRGCIRAKPLQPLEWLAKALPPTSAGPKPNRQEAIEQSNRAIVQRMLKKEA